MVTEKFPLSPGKMIEDISAENIVYYLDKHCCVFDAYFEGLRPKIGFESYIPLWKCQHISRERLVSNGRVIFADEVLITITNVDFEIISECYDYDSLQVKNFRLYEKRYLPTKFIQATIELYKDKTELKGVAGKEQE